MMNADGGDGNTAVGRDSLRFNTGDHNTVVGYKALEANESGSLNVTVGHQALSRNTTGSSNVALGNFAGRNRSAGNNYFLTSAERSIYIGANSKGKDNNDDNSIVIGYNAVGEGANTTVIGNENTTSTHLYGSTQVSGDLEVEGNITLSEPQGDISMGIFGNN